MTQSLVRLSKTVSHALRHEPWLYELELDEAGWTAIDPLLDALRRQRREWQDIDGGTLERMMADATKPRYEIRGNRIRALYGHSLPGRIVKESARPPERLYHGTSPAVAEQILVQGLRPMGRQYVHLSPDCEMAEQVGLRKARPCVVLRVDAGRAWSDGTQFYRGNECVWLADAVLAAYVQVTARDIASRNSRNRVVAVERQRP